MSAESDLYETIAGLHESIAAALGAGAMPVAVTAHQALASCFNELAAMKMEISAFMGLFGDPLNARAQAPQFVVHAFVTAVEMVHAFDGCFTLGRQTRQHQRR